MSGGKSDTHAKVIGGAPPAADAPQVHLRSCNLQGSVCVRYKKHCVLPGFVGVVEQKCHVDFVLPAFTNLGLYSVLGSWGRSGTEKDSKTRGGPKCVLLDGCDLPCPSNNIGLERPNIPPKMGQHSPKMGQHRPKIGSHRPKIGSTWAEDGPT